MSCTVDQLLAKCNEAITKNVQYIYGAKWQVLTKAQIQSLRKTYGSDMVWPGDDNKAGQICCDCSGLISAATGLVRGSSQYKSTALECYPISQRKPEMKGWAVWRQGHIGIYDGADGYYAMDGSAANAVHNPLSKNNFTHIIKLCDVDYGTTSTVKKSIDEIANEVIAGKWGNDPERGQKLTAAGYDYQAVKAKVNEKYGKTSTSTSTTPTTPKKPSCEVRIKTLNKGWATPVKDGQTAYNANDAIVGVAIKVSEGSVKYRVHTTEGKWLPYVTGYNINDYNNGWAGNGKMIDAIEVIYTSNGHKAKYRVATVNQNFWPYQTNNEKTNGQDGYAGVFGKALVRLELQIV